jgi:hypothetical protein
MRPEQARIGAAVKVRDSHRRPDLNGMVGTVMRTYASSGRTALHVRLEDGRWQLFWPPELDELLEMRGTE